MAFLLNLDFSNVDKLHNWLVHAHEKYYVELKKASGGLPNSLWESYSSFCNTAGGWLILGVQEGHPQNEIVGVGNPDKVISEFWNNLHNPMKISYEGVQNEDIKQIGFPEGDVIFIRVREAPNTIKPVYLNGRQDNTFIRTGDGDRKATREQIEALLRNTQPALDMLAAEKFTLADLDRDSLIVFKEIVSKRYPKKNYLSMTDESFLTQIGACFIDKDDGSLKIRKGTVLFLGKINEIRELYPKFHLDYFNRRGGNARWTDRVTDDEPNDYEMNLFNFYRIVYEKLRALMVESFRVEGPYQLRIPIADFDLTIRECLVNCLIHADYIQGYPSTKVEAFDGWIRFTNPGKMLVSVEQFIMGGDSRPRNEIVMKLFRLMGASERQGFGGPQIYGTAYNNDFRLPDITTDIEHTELRFWNIDLADSYPDLSPEEKDVLRFIVKSDKPYSIRQIGKELDIKDYWMRKIVAKLIDKGLIQQIGNGPATKYTRAENTTEELTARQIAVDQYKKQLQ